MPFGKIVGIDWSGAFDPRRGGKIQVAEYDPADRTVRLVGSRPDRADAWSREDVLEYVQYEIGTITALIGLDFAFAYPYCDYGQYFPGHDESPADLQGLWDTVEQVCALDGDFYGGQFYLPGRSTFSNFHHYRNPRHPNCQLRYRVTDEQAMHQEGLHPSSVFNCVGQKQVGPGSIAGMRFLREVCRTTDAIIWPIDVNGRPDRSTVVEIYPRLFLRQAEIAGIQPNAGNINELCAHFGADLQDAPTHLTDDQRDALVSAAGMGWLVRQARDWRIPDCAATHEGWIFGIEVR